MIAVVLAGGAGTRLWPVSRELYPKPFMKLPDGQSLLQKAFLRAVKAGAREVLTVTGQEHHYSALASIRPWVCLRCRPTTSSSRCAATPHRPSPWLPCGLLSATPTS